MYEAKSAPEDGGAPARMPDLSMVTLDDVFHNEDSAFTNSVRRVVEDARGAEKAYSAHGTTPAPAHGGGSHRTTTPKVWESN